MCGARGVCTLPASNAGGSPTQSWGVAVLCAAGAVMCQPPFLSQRRRVPHHHRAPRFFLPNPRLHRPLERLRLGTCSYTPAKMAQLSLEKGCDQPMAAQPGPWSPGSNQGVCLVRDRLRRLCQQDSQSHLLWGRGGAGGGGYETDVYAVNCLQTFSVCYCGNRPAFMDHIGLGTLGYAAALI